MMREKLMRLKSLLLFELPLDYNYVSTLFTTAHQQHQTRFPGWSLKATRKKIISGYWLRMF